MKINRVSLISFLAKISRKINENLDQLLNPIIERLKLQLKITVVDDLMFF